MTREVFGCAPSAGAIVAVVMPRVLAITNIVIRILAGRSMQQRIENRPLNGRVRLGWIPRWT